MGGQFSGGVDIAIETLSIESRLTIERSGTGYWLQEDYSREADVWAVGQRFKAGTVLIKNCN